MTRRIPLGDVSADSDRQGGSSSGAIVRRCDDGSQSDNEQPWAASEWWLIVANVAYKATTVERHFSDDKQAATSIVLKDVDDEQARLMGNATTGMAKGGRCVPIRAGVITNPFDPYAAHLYMISERGS